MKAKHIRSKTHVRKHPDFIDPIEQYHILVEQFFLLPFNFAQSPGPGFGILESDASGCSTICSAIAICSSGPGSTGWWWWWKGYFWWRWWLPTPQKKNRKAGVRMVPPKKNQNPKFPKKLAGTTQLFGKSSLRPERPKVRNMLKQSSFGMSQWRRPTILGHVVLGSSKKGDSFLRGLRTIHGSKKSMDQPIELGSCPGSYVWQLCWGHAAEKGEKFFACLSVLADFALPANTLIFDIMGYTDPKWFWLSATFDTLQTPSLSKWKPWWWRDCLRGRHLPFWSWRAYSHCGTHSWVIPLSFDWMD